MSLARQPLAGCMLGCLLGCLASCAAPSDLPTTMLWTWERPEDLTFLKDRNHVRGHSDVGVAHLMATVELLAPDRFTVRPNRNPLRLGQDTERIAVVRIENVRRRELVARLDHRTRRRLVDALVDASGRLDASGLQLDFDALHSQRDLYARLLVELRSALPANHGLGITALASWCVGDPWLEELPAGTLDYAVPMLFRMGPDASKIRRFLEQGGEFELELCRDEVGLSTDEPWPRRPSSGGEVRLWIFAPEPWKGMPSHGSISRARD